MQAGRIMRADSMEYVSLAWDGVNRSGWEALDDKVLVLVDEHVKQTSGGIVIPDQIAERHTLSSEFGTIIAVGPAAFKLSDDGYQKWTGRRPEPGDRVCVERYSGQLVKGFDGLTYRLMSQRCVGAVAVEIDERPRQTMADAIANNR